MKLEIITEQVALRNAIITRFKPEKSINIGSAARSTKMEMFRMMQTRGDDIVELFDDYGEFDFIWDTSSRTWIFYDELKQQIGIAKFVMDSDANFKKRTMRYEDQKRAFDAQSKLTGG